MKPRTAQERIETLEKTVAGLADLPAQVADVRVRLTAVESQIVRLEARTADGFSAIRRDLHQLTTSTDERFEQVNRRMDERFEQVNRRMDERFEQMDRRMDERFEETNTHMRVLHEKLVSDIRTLCEGRQ
jgi:DNA anti-recombination protein RmuC